MNRETTSKVHKGQQGANPKMRMLVYRERSYPARKVQGRDGSYTVAADSLVPELLDGIRSLDPAAFHEYFPCDKSRKIHMETNARTMVLISGKIIGTHCDRRDA